MINKSYNTREDVETIGGGGGGVWGLKPCSFPQIFHYTLKGLAKTWNLLKSRLSQRNIMPDQISLLLLRFAGPFFALLEKI